MIRAIYCLRPSVEVSVFWYFKKYLLANHIQLCEVYGIFIIEQAQKIVDGLFEQFVPHSVGMIKRVNPSWEPKQAAVYMHMDKSKREKLHQYFLEEQSQFLSDVNIPYIHNIGEKSGDIL